MTGSPAGDVGEPASEDGGLAGLVDDVDGPVLLFDGVCSLCNWSVRAVVRLDAEGDVRFAPLQSEVGRELLARQGLSPDYFDSLVLVEDDVHYTKSTAVLRVCRYLDGPLPLASLLVYLPRRLRDRVYDIVAEHRYRVFGKKDAYECPVPDERLRERFLERSLA